MRKIYLKIILPTILSILLFVLSIFFFIIPRFEQNIMDGKSEMIKELTNSAWSILAKYENDEKSGLLTRQEAQRMAVSDIRNMRYGAENKGYFWITDLFPTMIMHPYRSDLNGKDLTSFSDRNGMKVFVESVEAVKKSGQGYVTYLWQSNEDSLRSVPRQAYVKLFKPWNWVLGTGIYIEDQRKEISDLSKRMLWIPIAISVLLTLLLFYLFKQSLNIERKRIAAETELNESKERYRAIVEAATEGVIMLIDGKITFANAVISTLTGYDYGELANLPFNSLISKSNNQDVIDAFSKATVNEGQFEIHLSRKTGGFAEVLVTSSTTLFSGRTVNIFIVKDISVDKGLSFSNLDYQKLIGMLDIGFFKARIDTKGKFLFASETAKRIFGIENLKDMSDIHLLDLLAGSEDKKTMVRSLVENGFFKSKAIKIHKKSGEHAIIVVSLILQHAENAEDLICDGTVEDITAQEDYIARTNDLIAELKANDFMLEQSVKDYLKPVITLDADATLNDAIRVLSKKKAESVLLTKNETDYIGILTNTDIQKRILSLNLQLDNPAYLIMSSPVAYISENTSVLDAIRLCEEKRINHLAVKNESGELTGMLKTNDVYKMLLNSLSFFIAKIRMAETNDDLKQCYGTLQLLLKPRIKSEVSVKYVTKITTAFSDAITRRVIELSINEMGQPPVNFAFICLGSEGRKEETLYTDQDNAIVYGDVAKDRESTVNEYFNKLGERICNSLNYIGYSFCAGNIMAKNPAWCKPLAVWEKYFTNWIATPDAQNLLDATIFFDFRNVFGDEDLISRLRASISAAISQSPLFLYHMAYNTFNSKCPHISSGNILSDKHGDNVDLKCALTPLIMFARTYALQNHIWCSNTLERLTALKEKHIVSENTVDEIVFVYNFLMNLRLRNQIELMGNNSPVSNKLNTKKLLDIELFLLKKALGSIPDYQNKIKIDFRITA